MKVYGTVFLGNPRSDFALNTQESSFSMKLPMIVLATICVFIGVAPMLVSDSIYRVIGVCCPHVKLEYLDLNTVAPLKNISILAVVLIAGITGAAFAVLLRKRAHPGVVTWDCGYARPSNQMQYTASSFAQSITLLFQWVLRPSEHKPHLTGSFPGPSKMSTHVNEIVLDRLLVPISCVFERWAIWFHRFQQGLIQHYILYILITLFLMLCTQMPIREFVIHWFTH